MKKVLWNRPHKDRGRIELKKKLKSRNEVGGGGRDGMTSYISVPRKNQN